MDRNEFMKSLEQHYPDDMNDEQLDALEQFSFKLFDAGYAEDKVDILLANEGLNKLLTSNHDEHKARFLKLSELKQRNAELSSKVKSLVSQLWRFRKIFRSDTYDAVSSAKSLREVAMIVDFSVEQMLAEHDREVASRAYAAALITYTDEPKEWCHSQAEEYANKIKSGEVQL